MGDSGVGAVGLELWVVGSVGRFFDAYLDVL